MAGTHKVINSIRMTAWDVDAFNACGIAANDMDNGTFVVLGDMALNDATAGGFEYHVSAATTSSAAVWVVETPEVGHTVDQEVYDDIRYFYNKAGEPMSIKFIHPLTDCIEVPKSQITGNGAAKGSLVGIDAGALKILAEAPDSATYFKIEAPHTMDFGTEVVESWILRCMQN